MSTSDVSVKYVKQHDLKRNLKLDQELINPCLKEQDLSTKCLEQNQHDYNKCQAYFDNYNNCKKFWAQVTFNRRKNNIKPHLPLPQEREKIKAEYLSSENR